MSYPNREAIRLLTEQIETLTEARKALESLEAEPTSTIQIPGLPGEARNGQVRAKMLNVRQAATRLNVSHARVYQLVSAGELAGRKIDGEWQIDGSSVADRVAAH